MSYGVWTVLSIMVFLRLFITTTKNENILDFVLCNAFDDTPVADIVSPLVSSNCVKFDKELTFIEIALIIGFQPILISIY